MSGLPGHYIDHRFLCTQKIGGNTQKSHIEYVNPVEYCDTSRFAAVGITACIIGKIYIFHRDFGKVHFGHICHIVKEKGLGQNELVSRMWLGDVSKEESGFPPPSLANFIGNGFLYRYFSMPYGWAVSQWTHMLQEMGCIANLLPEFYQNELSFLSGKSAVASCAEELDYPEEEESVFSRRSGQQASRGTVGEGISNLLDAAGESSAAEDGNDAVTSLGHKQPPVGGAMKQTGTSRSGRKPPGRHASFDTAEASLDPIRLGGMGVGSEEKSQQSESSARKGQYKSDLATPHEEMDSGDDSTFVSSSTTSTSRKIGRGVGI